MSNDLPYYEKEGKIYDRITRILDAFPSLEMVQKMMELGKKEWKRRGSVAKKIGSNTDEVIRQLVCGKKLSKLKSQEAKNCFEAYQSWLKDYSPVGLKCVETVFHEELRLAGTPDLVWPWTGQDTVIDLKCSTEIRPAYWLQTEFYGRCLGVKFKAILRLDKDLGMYEYKRMPLNDEHWKAVCAAITLYRYFNKTERDVPQTRKEVINDSNVDFANYPV